MWLFIAHWLRRQPSRVQRVVYGVFALIGGVIVWAGVATGDWLKIVFGALVAAAWPFHMYVWSRIKRRMDERPYR
jgi:Flp pilus assembly protein TadB